MSASTTTTQVAALRKRLQKADLDDLIFVELVSEAVNVLSNEPGDAVVLETLSLSLTLFRQLRSIFEEQPAARDVANLVHSRLAPDLLPSRPCAKLLVGNLEGPTRTHIARATDALSALGRMVDVLPPPESSSSTGMNPISPLFEHLAIGKNHPRSSLVAINVLLPHVPKSAIPSTLQNCMTQELSQIDGANLRCSILSALLLRNSERINDEDERDKVLLTPLLPLLDPSQSHNVLLNLIRYLLPSVFTARPRSVHVLLALLGDSAGANGLSAWISIASLGVSMGQVDIVGLTSDKLQQAIVHLDDSVRLRAFQLLSSNKQMLRQDILDLIKMSFAYNAALPSAGARSEFSSAVYAFLKRIRDARDTAIRSGDVGQCARIQEFHDWLLQDFVDPGLEVARRYPVVRSILALSVLKLLLDVFGQEREIQDATFSTARVSALFACQASEFTEVRSRARQILEMASIPLSGYEALDTPSTEILLTSCFDSLNHPRKTQGEAGLSALCIIFRKLILRSQAIDAALEFVNKLGDRLEEHLSACERDLVEGLQKQPLHGIIAAIRNVVDCISLREKSIQQTWSPVFARLTLLVDRVWDITRPVISLARRQSEGKDAPEHEIAKAYEVLAEGEGEEEDENAMDHTNLLSGCWRATKEAGELLASLFSLPLAHDKDQTMWTIDQIDDAGNRFLTWMHEVRHRGTFSKIASAFTNLADAVKKIPNLRPLCFSWLQNELDIITTDSLSTTRRSAALPYSVLAIVSSDQELLDMAIGSLIELATVSNTASSDTTKVHAFNILKIVLLDAKQSKFLNRYFQRVVMTALDAFASNNWNVRNVGLIVFSTTVHRSLAPGRGTQDFFASKSTLATRQSLASWHHKYPSIIPHITSLLGQMSSSPKGNTHSPLFPILIIVRSLKWSEDGVEAANRLEAVLRPYLGSREWQIRIAAAQALSSVVSPARALELCVAKVASASADFDSLHGEILFRRHLVAEVIEWDHVSGQRQAEIEATLLGMTKSPGMFAEPLIAKAILDLLLAFADTVGLTTSSLQSTIVDLSASIVSISSTLRAGLDMVIASAGDALLNFGNGAYLSHLLQSRKEDLQIRVFDFLQTSDATLVQRVVPDIIAIVEDPSASPFAKVAAIEVLTSSPLSEQNRRDLAGLYDIFSSLVTGSRCVPLREAALAGLGHSISCSIGPLTDITKVSDLVGMIDTYSAIDQSQPSRYAALQALAPLAQDIYGATLPEAVLASLHKIVLRLLQDDDEDIRVECGVILSTGLASVNEVCQQRAIELEWEHIGARLATSPAVQPWVDLVWGALLDKEDFESDMKVAGRTRKQGEVLFELEPPNLFRDPFVDLVSASTVVQNHPGVFARSAQWSEIERMIPLAKESSKEHRSPIDEGFDAQRKLIRRAAKWEQVLRSSMR